LFSSISTTATSYPAAVRSATTRLPNEPSPTTMVVALGVPAPPPGRGGHAAPQQQVGDERDQERGGGHPGEHQRNTEQTQPDGLVDEAEVAVAHRRDRLGAEIQRVEPRHPRMRLVALVGEAQDDG
jgi:hypothetical protein